MQWNVSDVGHQYLSGSGYVNSRQKIRLNCVAMVGVGSLNLLTLSTTHLEAVFGAEIRQPISTYRLYVKYPLEPLYKLPKVSPAYPWQSLSNLLN